MRTRTIVTVALLSAAAAGCGTSGSTRQAPASKPAAAAATAAVAQAPAPAPAPPTTVLAIPAPVIAPAAPMIGDGPRQLELLADELRATEPKVVAARIAHFRPLCDAQGYPLVGNLMTKSARPNPGPVATFCAGVRGEHAQ